MSTRNGYPPGLTLTRDEFIYTVQESSGKRVVLRSDDLENNPHDLNYVHTVYVVGDHVHWTSSAP